MIKTATTKKLSIDVNEVLTNVEKWISEYNVKVKSTYKLVNPDTKSIKLTYSKNFDDLLTAMHKDTKECKLLNALKADATMKLKALYLADNNINALSLSKDKEGTSVIGYTDLRNDLVKDLGFIKTWTRRDQLVSDLKGYVKALEVSFPTVYNILNNTPEHRAAIFTNRAQSDVLANVLNNLRQNNRSTENSIISSPTREKFPNGDINRTAPFFTYLSLQQQGSWEIERITKYVQRMVMNLPRIFDKQLGTGYVGKDWEKLGNAFRARVIDTDVLYSLLEDIVCYFDYSMTSMAELLEGLKDPKIKLETFLGQLEARDKVLMQNFLAVMRSNVVFMQAILDMKNEEGTYNTTNGSRDAYKALKGCGVIGMDFELAITSLDLQKYFPYVSRYGTGNLNYYFNDAYTRFLKNLYATHFRVTCSPGKIASKLFNGHYTPVEVEEFTTLFKKHTATKASAYSIKIIEGALISHYYNEHMYSNPNSKAKKMTIVEAEGRAIAALHGRVVAHRAAVANPEVVQLGNNRDGGNRGGGSLWASCMKYPHCYNQILTYSKNPRTIKLLVALDSEGKLAARAVLWHHENGTIYLDRVYAMNERSRIDIFNWAEKRKFINIYYGNGAYNQELQFKNDGNNGLLFTVDNAIDNIPYFDTARRVDNRGIIALGNYTNTAINKASKQIEVTRKINAALAEPAPNVEPIIIKSLNPTIIETFKKKAVKKRYELSQEYNFALKASIKRKTDIAPRYTWMDLGGNRKRVLSSEFDMVLDFVNKKKVEKPEPFKAMTPKVITKIQLEQWKAEKASKLITTMNFLGSTNHRAA